MCARPANGSRWCSHTERKRMSRSSTAPEGSVSGAGPRETEIVCASGAAASSPTPAKNSAYASATRCGVAFSPGRSGSSPIAARMSRTAAATRSRSTATSRA